MGTRNYVVILGTSSRTGSFARVLAERLKGKPNPWKTWTASWPWLTPRGDRMGTPNNLGLVLSTLSGFVVHPNVGAVLCVDREPKP